MFGTSATIDLLDRTVFNLRNVWRDFRGQADVVFKLSPEIDGEEIELLRKQMRQCLDRRGGDVSARAQSAALGEVYLDLNDKGRLRFLTVLAEDFGVDHDQVVDLARQLSQSNQVQATLSLESSLREALRPTRVELLTQLNSLPSGVRFLVDLRADLRRLKGDSPHLAALDSDLQRLLRSWFDVGFLDLERITWNSPAALLEKLVNYEAVHRIRSWADLKNRLDSDRRCYAFFHHNMSDEPLIFVQVALVKDISDNVQELLDETADVIAPQEADTAIFYSITNTQAGLQGVSFGNFLIKKVVESIKTEYPNIKTFSTLSPVPGFRKWLDNVATSKRDELLTDNEHRELAALAGTDDFFEALDKRDWMDDEALNAFMKKPLMRLCAGYLVHAKRRGRSTDPVANFHLNNGACLERINWMGDTSVKGLSESASMMVNYVYNLDDIEQNHENYREDGKTTASPEVYALASKQD